MGTRGIFGVRVKGKDKLIYNHFDSYPSGLGLDMLNAFKKMARERGIEWIKERANALRLFNQDIPPSTEVKEELEAFADLSVSERSLDDWYCLTRSLQGDIEKTLEVGINAESNEFINDSLFCEWGYVINLDDNKFEVYKGFQHHPHEKGRFAKNELNEEEQRHYSGGPYYPCALVAEFPLDALPDDDAFLKALKPSDE